MPAPTSTDQPRSGLTLALAHPANEVQNHSSCESCPNIHMRPALFLAGWLCSFFAPAPSASAAAAALGEHSKRGTSRARTVLQPSASTGHEEEEEEEGEMASTALDFREMMRKERELAMKKRVLDTSPTIAR